MLEIAEIKISNNKQPLKHIKTLIFLVNVTLEKPPTTLGENQFESSSLFLKNVFLQQENFSKIFFFFSKQTYPFSAQRTTWKLLSFQQKISFFCLFLLLFCLSFCCSDFAEELPGMCAKLLPLSPSCPEISLALLLSFSQSAHERMNDLFLLFLL
jgi:hypothetical protein